jgi:hypothetical protein
MSVQAKVDEIVEKVKVQARKTMINIINVKFLFIIRIQHFK